MKTYERIKFLNKQLTSLIDEKEKVDMRFIGESFWLKDDEINQLLDKSDKLKAEIQKYNDELEALLPLLRFYNIGIIAMAIIIIATGIFSLTILMT